MELHVLVRVEVFRLVPAGRIWLREGSVGPPLEEALAVDGMGQAGGSELGPGAVAHLPIAAPEVGGHRVRLAQPVRHVFGTGLPPGIIHDLRDAGHLEAKAWEQKPFLFSGIPLSDILPVAGLKCQVGGKSRALLNALVGTRLWLAFPAHEGGSVAAVAGGRLEPWEVDRRTRVQGCLTRFLAEQRLVPKQTSNWWFPSRRVHSPQKKSPAFQAHPRGLVRHKGLE